MKLFSAFNRKELFMFLKHEYMGFCDRKGEAVKKT